MSKNKNISDHSAWMHRLVLVYSVRTSSDDMAWFTGDQSEIN